MNNETIEQDVLWYLEIYEGRYSNTKEKLINKYLSEGSSKNRYQCSYLIDNAFDSLRASKKISIVSVGEMSEQQLFEFEKRNQVFYKINK